MVGSPSGCQKHPMLSHPEPLLKPFLIHKVRSLSPCHTNWAYWAGAERGSDQRGLELSCSPRWPSRRTAGLKMSQGCILSSQLWIHLTEVPGLKKKKSELPEWTLALLLSVVGMCCLKPMSLHLAPLDHAGEKTLEVTLGLLVTSDRH